MNENSSFTVKYSGLSRTLSSRVLVSDPTQTRLIGKSLNSDNQKEYNAVWDTGATGTVITKKIADELNLKPTGVATVHHAGGMDQRQCYSVDMVLPNRAGVGLVTVTEAPLPDGTDVLIGMDIITLGDFAVSNFNNKTTFTFRMPSLMETNYVKAASKNSVKNTEKPGRNAPCPCGSGKKYKNCCGRNN